MTQRMDKQDKVLPHALWEDATLEHVLDRLTTLYDVPAQPPELRARVDMVMTAALTTAPRFQEKRTVKRFSLRRQALILAGIVAAVVVGGVVYAASPLVDSLFPSFLLRHSQEVSLSYTTSCGVTITVTRAYADANRVIVGFTLTGRDASKSPSPMGQEDPNLIDAHGRLLQLLSATGGVKGSTQGRVLEFDGAPLVRPGHPLPLHFAVFASRALTSQTKGRTHTSPSCATAIQQSGTTKDGSRFVVSQGAPVNGRFIVALTVRPVSQVREVDPHQVMYVGGERIALERVVVTPSDVHLYLRRAAATELDVARPQLKTTTGTYDAVPISIQTSTGVHLYFSNFKNPAGVVEYDAIEAPSLYGDHKPWTLSVPTGHGRAVFHVKLP